MRDRLEDFSFSVITESSASRDVLRVAQRLLQQDPPRTDLVIERIQDVLPRLERIGDAGRTLSGMAERIARPRISEGEAPDAA